MALAEHVNFFELALYLLTYPQIDPKVGTMESMTSQEQQSGTRLQENASHEDSHTSCNVNIKVQESAYIPQVTDVSYEFMWVVLQG